MIEIFGTKPFSPEQKEERVTYTDKQREIDVYERSEKSQLINHYIHGEERSFTIIAYPVPSIGEKYEEIFAETVSQQFLRQFGMMILDWRVLRAEISRSPILAGAEPEHYLIYKVRFAMSGNTGDGEHPPRFQPHDFVQIRYSQFHARSIPLFKQLVQPLP